jgi:TolB-like protein
MSEHTAQSVLIAPLTAITDDEQTRAFAAGLSVELQHAVFRQPDLQVVQQLPENPLESALILSGSVRVYDQSTRINLQLVEAVTSRLLWSDSFDCPLNAILGLQTQIARQTGQRLQRSFSGKV